MPDSITATYWGENTIVKEFKLPNNTEWIKNVYYMADERMYKVIVGAVGETNDLNQYGIYYIYNSTPYFLDANNREIIFLD